MSKDGISFFMFPSDPVLKERWIRQVQRTCDQWSGPSQHSVLCARHFTEDCFEPDSAIAATMGLTKRRRLKPDAVPTVFERQAPLHSRPSSSGARSSRKRATTTPGTTGIGSGTQVKKSRQAYEKRERSRVRMSDGCIYTVHLK